MFFNFHRITCANYQHLKANVARLVKVIQLKYKSYILFNKIIFFSILEYSLLTCYDNRVDCVTYTPQNLYCALDPSTAADCKRYCGFCASNNHLNLKMN